MQKPNNWDNVQAAGTRSKLPAGGYVIKVQKAEIIRADSGFEYLDLTIEICEGQFKDYYTQDYNDQTNEPKRYKGHFRQGTPQPGMKDDDFVLRGFKGLVTAFEESNPGYTWDWNEQSLVGKVCGCLFRNEEYDYNGFQGFTARPWRMTSADKIRSGQFQTPKDKRLDQGDETNGTSSITFEEIKDEEIPF